MATYEAKRYTFTGANITSIPTSAVSSGTFADARISSGSVTQHVTATTQAQGTWTPAFNTGGINVAGLYSRTGNIVTCTAQGNWTSQAANSNNAFVVSGLPITAYNSGTNVGSGSFHAFLGHGTHTIKVIPNTTTFQIYTINANLATTTTKSTDRLSTVFIDDENGTNGTGFLISKQNLRDGSDSTGNMYFAISLVYMV